MTSYSDIYHKLTLVPQLRYLAALTGTELHMGGRAIDPDLELIPPHATVLTIRRRWAEPVDPYPGEPPYQEDRYTVYVTGGMPEKSEPGELAHAFELLTIPGDVFRVGRSEPRRCDWHLGSRLVATTGALAAVALGHVRPRLAEVGP